MEKGRKKINVAGRVLRVNSPLFREELFGLVKGPGEIRKNLSSSAKVRGKGLRRLSAEATFDSSCTSPSLP